jgi:hypothetical protein
MSLQEILANDNVSRPWTNLFANSLDAGAVSYSTATVQNLIITGATGGYLYSGATGVVDAQIIQQSDVAGLVPRLNADETSIAVLNSEVGTLNTTVGALSTNVATNTTNITTLNGQVSTLNTQVGTLNSEVGINNTAIATLQVATTAITYNPSTITTIVASDISTPHYGDGTNAFLGAQAGACFNNSSTSHSVVIGYRSVSGGNTAGIADMVLIGHNVAPNLSTDLNVQGNVIIGQFGGAGIVGGSRNVLIGRDVQPTTDVSDCIVIGDGGATTNDEIVIGTSSSQTMRTVTANQVSLGTSAINYLNAYFSGVVNTNTITPQSGTLTLNGTSVVIPNTLNITNGANISGTLAASALSTSSISSAGTITIAGATGVIIPTQAYGAFIATAGSTLAFTAATWRTAPLPGVSKFSNLFTVNTSTGLLTYTGGRTRAMSVTAIINITCSTPNDLITAFISYNSNITPSTSLATSSQYLPTTANNYQVIINDIITMNTNDTITIAMLSSTTATITFVYASINAISLLN